MSITVPKTDLPVEEILPRLVEVLCQTNTVILQAPPGAGKTTTVPLWLLTETDKKIIMLEPRRLAARAAATRMASLLGEKVGQTVGYRIRLDTKVSNDTRIEVVTEGILTRMLQTDPELADIGILIFDEFHERNLQTDLGLALARQSQEILREDLKLLIMSATLDTEQLSQLLGGAPTVTSEGRQFPVETRFLDRPVSGRIEAPLAREIEAVCDHEKGDLLVFLPGAGEINRTLSHLADYAKKNNIALYPLFGNLSQKEQDKALFPDPEGRRKIVCATDIAETSLTIEGIRIVVDSGLSRVPLFDPNSGMSRLETKKISRASADQRRGRAGRLGPGICLRMWTAAEDRGLIPHSSPEIAVADLSSLALDLAKWGITDANELDWLTLPPDGLLAQAKDLLVTLGALDKDGNLTRLGEQIVRLPLHPRLATMIVKAKDINLVPLACDIAALLSERDILKNQPEIKNADLLSRLEQLNKSRRNGDQRPEIKRVLRNSDDLRRRFKAGKEPQELVDAGILLAFAYPDRIGELRKNSKTVYRLSGGRVASLDVGDKLSGTPFIVVADLDGKGRDARIYRAAAISRSQLLDQFAEHIIVQERVFWEEEKNRIQALEEERIGALVLSSKKLENPPKEKIVKALCEVVQKRELRDLPWSKAANALVDRVNFARKQDKASDLEWPDYSQEALQNSIFDWLPPYIADMEKLEDFQSLNLENILKSNLGWQQQQRLDEFAPPFVTVPTGSKIRLDYSNTDIPVLPVRLQEMFGQERLAPVADGQIPLTIHFLSPAGRPAQITKDLKGFWENSYDAVKKDLKGQYPKHYWPDDPMQAEPTARAKPRKK